MHSSEISKGPRLVVKILLFVASAVFAYVISWLAFGDTFAGDALFFGSLLCAIPIFVFLTWTLRKEGVRGTVLPLLVLPLVFILLFAYISYESSPQSYFKNYVAKPIPAGITNIQLSEHSLDGWVTQIIVITFQASPEAIDRIIAQEHWVREDTPDISSDWGLPDYSRMVNWEGYRQKFGNYVGGSKRMWVDPKQFKVIFAYHRTP